MDFNENHPDIKFLRDYNLMNEPMIKRLINERKLFMQKSTTNELTRYDCMKLIKLELNVLNICDIAIHTNYAPRVFYIREVNEIMKLMCNRIDHLYYSMFQKFSIGCSLLIEYMQFQWKNELVITNENNTLIALMSAKKFDPLMFIAAGMFQYENHNIVNARQYFEEGIKIHTDNKTLYLEQLWIEVMYLDDEGGKTNIAIAIRVYRNIIEKFEGDMEFHIILLDRSLEIKSISILQYKIICDLMEIYKQSDFMWRKVANLCSEGFIFHYDHKLFIYSTDFEAKARSCIATHKKGLENVLSVISKRNLIDSLNDYIIKIWKMNKSINNMEVNNLVRSEIEMAFQMGHFEFGGLQKPEYYVYWVAILYNIYYSTNCPPEILKLAIELNRDNINVWTEVLEHIIAQDSSNLTKIKIIFAAANYSLRNNSLPVWEVLDSFLDQRCDDYTLIGEFYEEGAYSRYKEVRMAYRVKYHTWCHMYQGISHCRHLFHHLITLEPENKSIYMDRIQCEKRQNRINVNIIKNLYSLTCFKFGPQENDVSLWAEYLEFELTYSGRYSAERIYRDALKVVKPHLKDDLRRTYHQMIEARRRRAFNILSDIIDLTNDG